MGFFDEQGRQVATIAATEDGQLAHAEFELYDDRGVLTEDLAITGNGTVEKSLYDIRGKLVYLARYFQGKLVLESTFAVVDIWFVAKLGASAVATVGLTETYLFLLYSIAMGLAMAVTAIVALYSTGWARRCGRALTRSADSGTSRPRCPAAAVGCKRMLASISVRSGHKGNRSVRGHG